MAFKENYRFNQSTIKIIDRILHVDFKILLKLQRLMNKQKSLEKRSWKNYSTKYSSHDKAILNNIVWYWCYSRQLDHWDKIESKNEPTLICAID